MSFLLSISWCPERKKFWSPAAWIFTMLFSIITLCSPDLLYRHKNFRVSLSVPTWMLIEVVLRECLLLIQNLGNIHLHLLLISEFYDFLVYKHYKFIIVSTFIVLYFLKNEIVSYSRVYFRNMLKFYFPNLHSRILLN